jgi:hypothetical protein
MSCPALGWKTGEFEEWTDFPFHRWRRDHFWVAPSRLQNLYHPLYAGGKGVVVAQSSCGVKLTNHHHLYSVTIHAHFSDINF